jgi:hypothetical protein
MSVRNVSPSPTRSRSGLDHRAIRIAGHLLLGGIWLERQFGSVPKALTTLAAESATSGPTATMSRFSLLTPRPFPSEKR